MCVHPNVLVVTVHDLLINESNYIKRATVVTVLCVVSSPFHFQLPLVRQKGGLAYLVKRCALHFQNTHQIIGNQHITSTVWCILVFTLSI